MPSSEPGNQAAAVLVAGEWRTRDSLALPNPARPGELSNRCPQATPEDIDDAVAAAAEAEPAWERLGAFERAGILDRAAGLVAERAAELSESMAATTGKAIRDARAEVSRTASILRHFAAEAGQPKGEVYDSSGEGVFLFTTDEPLGVIGAITPWNFPLAIPAWKIAPALAFGNTVVWKPAEIASRSALQLTSILLEAGLPPKALNLLTGSSRNFGDRLITHPGLAAITFTGSNQVGNLIREKTAAADPRLQLELGGNNPALVLADADLESAAAAIVSGAMGQSGQRCTATRRVVAVEPVAEPLGRLIAARVEQLRVGEPLADQTEVGPLSSLAAHEEVSGYLELAEREGCEAIAGGAAGDPEDGYYVEPTVFFDVDPGSKIARDEIFGPVTSLIVAEHEEQALALANDTPFGLSASLFTDSLGRSLELTRRIEAGVVHVNDSTTGAEPHVPFGGIKASGGHFREQGRAARRFFTKGKTVYMAPEGRKSS